MSNKPLDEKLMAASENLYSLACEVGKLQAENEALKGKLAESIKRLKDMLMQDDDHAYKEAVKFLNKLEV